MTIVQVSPKGFPVRVGKSFGSGTGISKRGQSKAGIMGMRAGTLRVAIGGLEK
jgi:hypothetical protein